MATPVGFVKTGYVTASSAPGSSSVHVYKKLGGKYMKFYTISGGKPASYVSKLFPVKNASGTVKQLGAFLKANKKAKALSPAKAKSPAKANVMAGYTKTNVTYGGKVIYKKNGEYYLSGMPPVLLGKEKFITKPNGSIASLASLNKAKTPVNAMAGYTKTNLKAGAFNVYKKNGDYFYKKANGQPQKLGQAAKVTKPGGITTHLKMLNYNKTSLKYGSMNVYKNAAGNYYYTHIYVTNNKPIKIEDNSMIKKPNGTLMKVSNLPKTVTYKRLGDMVYFGNPVYYNVEGGKIKAYYKKADSYIQIVNLNNSIYKPTDTALSKPIKIKAYLRKLEKKLGLETLLSGAVVAPAAAAAPPPAIITVTLVPIVKPGPDHIKAKVSEFTAAVDKVAKRLKKLQEVTGGTSNKNTNYKNLCSKGNGMAYMKRSNTLHYKYSKISGSLRSGGWKSIIKKPEFTYATYDLKLSYAQYLAHQQLLFNYGRNVNSFENVRLSDMMDLNWFAAQDKYIRSLSTREIFTIGGYSYNGDTWSHAYLDGTFNYNTFRSSVSKLEGTYFAFFFQARDFYKINTGDILKDYDETVIRVKDDKNNENIKSIIHMFINDLNEIIRKAPSVTRAFILFRGNKDDKYLTGAVNNTYTTERFCSASVAGSVARLFASGHELQRITVMKGSKCLLMFGITQVSGEWEILLPRGSTYQVVKKRQNLKSISQVANMCGGYQGGGESIRNLTDVVLLGTVEDAKAVEAVPVEVHPATNVHVMQRYIENWPVTITGVLGKGGMGVVYQGTNTSLMKNVAIKFQKKSINSNTEKAALKKLFGLKITPKFYKNMNIVANNYLHAQTPKVKVGNQMSVMESNLIKGSPLKKWYTGAPVPKDIGNAVKNAISKMHSRGVIHGNLHSNNIIISNSNKRAYIIDFGKALVTNGSFTTPQNANNKLKTLGKPGLQHYGKNTVITPNGASHFFNGPFLKRLKVANS